MDTGSRLVYSSLTTAALIYNQNRFNTMSIDQLFEQLKHPNPHLRDQAAVEIYEQRDHTTISRLMAAMDDQDTNYRRSAVKAIGMIGHDAVPVLVEAMLNSDNVTVRGSATKALAQVAINYPDQPFPPQGLEGLRQALLDLNPVVNIAAAMALGQIGTPALPILADTLKTTDNVALQVSLLNAMTSIGGEEVKQTLTTIAEDNTQDTYVRETATSALSRLDFVKANTWNG
jgi:bilin biosynthesis protein